MNNEVFLRLACLWAAQMVRAGFCKWYDIKGDNTCYVLWEMYQTQIEDQK